MDLKKMSKKLGAEFIGTFLLVLGGCGSAIFAAKALAADKTLGGFGIFNFGIGYMGVALAFGLTVVCGAYALGHVSGGHFNPAVSVGLATAGRVTAGLATTGHGLATEALHHRQLAQPLGQLQHAQQRADIGAAGAYHLQQSHAAGVLGNPQW